MGAIEVEGNAAQIYDWHAIVTHGIRVINIDIINI